MERLRRGKAQDRERRVLGKGWRPDRALRLQTTNLRYAGLAQDTSSNLCPRAHSSVYAVRPGGATRPRVFRPAPSPVGMLLALPGLAGMMDWWAPWLSAPPSGVVEFKVLVRADRLPRVFRHAG